MSAFNEHCNKIVSEYIQTVLIIDDKAFLNSPNNIEATELIEPTPEIRSPFEAHNEALLNRESNEQNEHEYGHSHDLNSLKLTNGFYQLGIVAGLYQPDIRDGESPQVFAEKVKSASSNSDIIILDWMLKDSDSRYSKSLVKNILDNDKESGGRLRAIIIYTGENNLNALRTELYEYLNDEQLKDDQDFKLYKNDVLIQFCNKSGTLGALNSVAEENLPKLALESFSSLVNGLIPSFAIKAASEIRSNIGKLSAKFSRNIDAGYLTHRALIPNPDDAELFLLEIFVTYLRSILAISRTDNECLGINIIEKWIEDNAGLINSPIEVAGTRFTLDQGKVLEILKDGYDSDRDDIGLRKVLLETRDSSNNPISKSKVNKFIKEDVHSLFGNFSISGKTLESIKELSVLSLFKRTRTDINRDFPYLTQGTVIYCMGSEEYWLCVTPKCDTVRLKSSHNFSFAPLKQCEKRFDLVIPSLNCENYITLATQDKFYDLKHIEFSPSQDGRVQCEDDNGRLVFKTNERTAMKYMWIGDLEELQAQNRVVKIIGDLSRNGVDEMEWLRQQ